VIVEAVALSSAAVIWKAFDFARWMIEQYDPSRTRRAATEAKRVILERQRAGWSKGCDAGSDRERILCTQNIVAIDDQLLKLADEED
jgi:hypothetical protein